MSVSKDLVDIIKGSDDKGTKAYDTPATVTRVDGSTVWVHIPGGVDETPVKKTINAKQGDTVQVRVSGGSAWLNGNASAPPTDDTQANVAVEYALVAGNAADSAVKSASIASEAAADAKATADSVHGIATQALADAATAKGAADNASEYAARALGNLSTVQSVTETLTWITQHGTMALTTDVALDPTHVYFVVDAGGDYVVGGVTYAIVTEPDVDDIGTYYELTIDESLNNYVGTHLALTSEGLWLLPASTGTNRVLVATGAGSVYTTAGTYIIDSDGTTVLASFRADGETIGVSDGTQSYIALDYHSLQMIDKEGDNYFYASDLRDTTGITSYTENIIATGLRNVWTLSLNYYANLVVKLNGVTQTEGVNYSFDAGTNDITFTSFPTSGSLIELFYDTDDEFAKAYTHGKRQSGTDVGAMSVAEGKNITASGFASHAEGVATRSQGNISHAEGIGSYADGYASHAEGINTRVKGYSAHSEGEGTEAGGIHSHAQNYYTKATSANQTALGKFNIEDSADTYAVIIGNGTADNARSNALTVDWSGNVVTAGDITVSNGTPPYYNIKSSRIDLTESAPVSDTLHDQTIRHYDANGTRIGQIEVYRTTADVMGTAIQVARTINGALVHNTIAMRIDANGDMSYTVGDAEAFRSAIGIADSGWTNITPAAGFALYDADAKLQSRKVGCMVEVYGILKPTSALPSSGMGSNITMFTLPTNHRPSQPRRYLMQGSGNSTWLMTIFANGNVGFSRYRDLSVTTSSGYSNCPSGAWLNFNATFFSDNYTI